MSQWRLRTLSSEYVVSLLPDGSALALDYWGEPVDVAVAPGAEVTRKPHYQHRLDATPLEYASAGQRHVTSAELHLDRGDSYTGAAWHVDAEATVWSSDEGGDLLEVSFLDETGTLRLILHTSTRRDHDIVRRRVRLENTGPHAIDLPKVHSAAWNVLPSRTVRVDYLAGRWGEETQRRHVELSWGTFGIGSRQGITSHSFAPTVTVTPVPDEDSPACPTGGAWGIALEWSGSWRLQVDSDPSGQRGVRVSCGIDEDTSTITLLPGERFVTPDSVGLFSAEGAEGVTRAWHRYQHLELARDLTPATHPIVYNSWYATTFDVRVEHQLELATIAQSIGVETFVVDDGWFTGRTTDTAGLGDWVEDVEKFPHGLSELADRVHDLGMGFGLWIEPEMVNPDSDLYRAHPEWVYRAGERPLIQSRTQYVLDLGLPEVEAWIAGTLRRLLGSTRITYLKWDMNRTVTDGGRIGDPHGRQWSVQHTDAYYRLLRMLRDEFPHVTVEACAGGGGRIDHRVLGLSDVVWVSDEVGAQDRLVIQDGFLSAYPAHAMLGLVSDFPGMRDASPRSFAYRFAVCMTGALGIGSDLLAWDESERAQASELVEFYKQIRDVVLRGTVRVHGRPRQRLYSIEYRSAGDDGRIVVFVFDQERDRGDQWTATMSRVHPTQLLPGRRYRVESTGQIVDGALALRDGIDVPFGLASDADILVLTPVD